MRILAGFVVGIFATLVLLAAGVAQSTQSAVLVGKVFKVTGGDTIRVQLPSGPIVVRLDSIDAPESSQPHGAEATAALVALVANREVQLEVVSQDRYERLVATVFVGGVNVNEQQVRLGHAWAYRLIVRNLAYCNWEGAARAQRLGLWALPPSDWIFPYDWRRLQSKEIPQPQDFSQETVAACKATIGQRTRSAPTSGTTQKP